MKYLSLLILASLSSQAFAAGAGHISDLIAPAVNFIIFSSILYFALRKPVVNSFKENAENVIETYERAQVKKKEADLLYNDADSKMKASESEVQSIVKRSEEECKNFEKNYKAEVQDKIQKFKVDSKQRLVAEKNTLISKLSDDLVSEIVGMAKENISKDGSLKSKATEKMLKGVQ